MNKKRSLSEILHIVLLVAVSLSLVSCAGAATASPVPLETEAPSVEETVAAPEEPEQVELTFVTHMAMEGAFQAGVMKFVDGFMAENPDIKIKVLGIPWEKMQQQAILMVSAGNAFDVRIGNPQWVAPLALMGALEPLDTWVDPAALADLDPTMIDPGRFDGKLYSVTMSPGAVAFAYNKEVMKRAGLDPNKPPATWEEMISMAKQVGALGGDTYGWGYDTSKGEQTANAFWVWSMAYGGGFRDSDGNLALNSPQNVEALTAWQDLAASPNGVAKVDIREARNLFAHDKLAFTMDGPWLRAILRDVSGIGQDFDSHWGVALMPAGTGGSQSFQYGFTVEMFAQCKHKPEAARFVNYLLTSPIVGSVFFDDWGFMKGPTSQQAELLDDPYFGVFVRQLPTASPLPADHPQYTTMTSFVSAAVQAAILEGADPKTVLDQVQSTVTDLYAQ